MGRTVGLRRAAPSAFVNCAFVTGFGAVEVHGALDVTPKGVTVGRGHVTQLDPAPPLLARADASADTELEREQHPLERSTSFREHGGLAEADHADPGRSRGVGGCLPGPNDIGEEARSLRRLLGEDLVAAVAVEADGRCTHHHRGSRVESSRGPGEQVGRLDARFQDLALVRLGPPLPDVHAAQVHDRVDPEELRSVEIACRGIPTELVSARRLASDEPEHLVSLFTEGRDERGSDEPGRAADDDSHASILTAGDHSPAV